MNDEKINVKNKNWTRIKNVKMLFSSTGTCRFLERA